MTDAVHLAAFNDRGEILFTVSGSPDTVEFSLRLNTSLPYLTLSSPAVPALQYVAGANFWLGLQAPLFWRALC